MRFLDSHTVDMDKASTQRMDKARIFPLDLDRPVFDIDKFVKDVMNEIAPSKDQALADYLFNLHRKRIADDDSLVVIVEDDGFGRDE